MHKSSMMNEQWGECSHNHAIYVHLTIINQIQSCACFIQNEIQLFYCASNLRQSGSGLSPLVLVLIMMYVPCTGLVYT